MALLLRKDFIPKMKQKHGDGLFLAMVALFWFAQYVFVPFLSPHLIALGITASFAGVIMGAYGVAQLVLRVPVSVGEDICGRHKAFICAGLLLLALASAIALIFSSPVAYLVFRTLTGVAASTWVSYTAAFTQHGQNGKQRMGKLIAANNFGVMLSYIVGGVLYQAFGMDALLLASVGSALLALGLTALWKPEHAPEGHPFQPQAFVKVLSNGHLWRCGLLMALGMQIVFATSSSFVSSYAKLLGADSLMLSLIAVAFNAMGTLMSWAYAQGAMARLSERAQLVVSFLILALYCALHPLCVSPWQVALVQLLGGAGRSILYTLLMAVAAAEIPPESQTTANGVFQSLYSLGMTAGPVVMGQLIDRSGSYPFSFLMMAAAALLGVAWSLLRYRRKNETVS